VAVGAGVGFPVAGFEVVGLVVARLLAADLVVGFVAGFVVSFVVGGLEVVGPVVDGSGAG
jgi:hypothetical protein